MIKSKVILFLILVILGFSVEIYSQIEGDGEKLKKSDSSSARYDEIKSNINKELKELKNHKWAGEYYFGDGLGINVSISLAPKSGFIFTWVGCLGLYDLNYGKVEEKDGKIIFLTELPNKREGFQGIETEFYPILWGERHYLIPTERMIDFINSINGGYEPSPLKSFGTLFALRKGDEEKKTKGKPSLPKEFQDYLLEKPITAKVLQVLESDLNDDKNYNSKRITTMIILDVGSRNGVKKGMEFHVYSPTDVYEDAEIMEVEENTSKAKIVQIVFKDVDSKIPAINWKLSTNSFKH